MEQVEVEITGQAITARYGTLSAGDILRTDKEFAKHLVDDCGAAKYVKAKAAAGKAEPTPAPAPRKPSAAKPAKVKVAAERGTGKAEPGSDSDLATMNTGQPAPSVQTSEPESGAASTNAPV